MTRGIRAIALTLVALFTLTGCGAVHGVLGIHQAPRVDQASVPLTLDQAKGILTRDFTAAQQVGAQDGAAARAALRTAYTGDGLRAANARLKLAKVQPTGEVSPLLAPEQPRLLAVPRGFGFPRVILAQTVASEGPLPVLYLLTSPDAATPYKISASATMLLGSSLKPFDSLAKGSPLVTGGTGLAVDGNSLLGAYAAGLTFPAKAVAKPLFASDPFYAQVRAKAAGIAKAVVTQARFSQVHKVVPGSVYAVRQASGDALVFGVLERKDSFAVKSGQAVNTAANKEFVLLSGKKRITRAATITTLEFVVFAVPRSSGQARLVAASEQVVAGSGS
ncbi:MAG: hypothetical protein ABI662_07050 [Dermatophilaceae bacterium]